MNTVSKSRKPVDLQAVRTMVANTVAGQALGITSALAEEAKKGELAHPKFLFEMIGLYPVTETPASEEDQGRARRQRSGESFAAAAGASGVRGRRRRDY